MKKVEITLYKFSELSKDAKEKAINSLSDINVDYDWWSWIHEDAKGIGCEISGFDIERRYCNLKLCENGFDIAVKIEQNHGEKTDTFAIAKTFMADYDEMFKKFADKNNPEKVNEEKEDEFDSELAKLEISFHKQLARCYLIMLRDAYEYLISEKAIIESIESNDYYFTEDGKLY